VSHVLTMTALEVGDPVLLFVLMKADDLPGDRRPRLGVTLQMPSW
jgi:hypothetical protein